MDTKKSIESLKNIIEYWTYKPTEVEAVKLAILALEKQIPKKVIRERAVSQECPVCGFIINGEYCNKCGQRLDRDNTND